MPRLASPIDSLQEHYEVLVTGSGHGGSMAASRVPRAGMQVCVIERAGEHCGERMSCRTESGECFGQ